MVSRLVRGEESASSTLATLTNARVAHLAERALDKREVSGSSPGTCTVAVAKSGKAAGCEPAIVGSNPTGHPTGV